MNLGFETVGNATLIVHDSGPLLATDPWVKGFSYFGSWSHSHQIPAESLDSISKCKYVWISHGHPDHLSSDSLSSLAAQTILVPNHYGGRIAHDLRELGYNVRVLDDRVWVSISDRVRIMCIPDYNQDAALLVDINGTLVLNMNDSSALGAQEFIRKLASTYPKSFLLQIQGFGDANMINLYDDHGERLPSVSFRRTPLGPKIAASCAKYGVNHFVPFSSMHQYQRSDSAWANDYAARLEDFREGFVSDSIKLLPAFIRYDCETHSYAELKPDKVELKVRKPEEFGDNWDERLEPAEVLEIKQYFSSMEKIATRFDFIGVRVGGEEHVFSFRQRNLKKGFIFEAPRSSLTQSVRYKVFDDMMIGNFMKTHIHGRGTDWDLYLDFIPHVGKYADNGGARSKEELDDYFLDYRRRAPFEYFKQRLERNTLNRLRWFVGSPGSPSYRVMRRAYKFVKAARSL